MSTSLTTTTSFATPAPIDAAGPDYTATSLVLPEDLTFERWEQIGQTLDQMSKAIQWWIGVEDSKR